MFRLAAAFLLLCASSQGVAQQLVITTDRLPEAVEGRAYSAQLEARGGTPPYRWTAASALPAGLTLDPGGAFTGRPQRVGDFPLLLQVKDSSRPANSATRSLTLRVRAVLTIAWTRAPSVMNGGIFGEATVTNSTEEALDLTVIIVAVNETGRATALGYQHFSLDPGEQKIAFGSTLPRGKYVVHGDAVAEMPSVGAIRRARLQTAPLQVP